MGFAGGHHTEKQRKKWSRDRTGMNNPMYGVRCYGKDNPFYGKYHSTVAKRMMSDKAKERLSDPRNHPMFGEHRTLGWKKRQSERMSGENNPMWGWRGKDCPNWRRYPSEKTRQLLRNVWKDPEHARKVFSHRSPNRKELECFGIISSVVPKLFKYVGNGELNVGGKFPDFVSTDGSKLLIEFNSDYWHRGENTRTRARHFAKYGYKTLFIWQHELKYPKRLRRKILRFVGLV
jgi:hypothetical protein